MPHVCVRCTIFLCMRRRHIQRGLADGLRLGDIVIQLPGIQEGAGQVGAVMARAGDLCQHQPMGIGTWCVTAL